MLYSTFSSANIDINNLSTDLELEAGFSALNIDAEQIISKETSPDNIGNMNLGEAASIVEQSSTSISSSITVNPRDKVPQMNNPGDAQNPNISTSQRQELGLPIQQPILDPSGGLRHEYQSSELQSQPSHETVSHYQQLNPSYTAGQDLETLRTSTSNTYALPQAGMAPTGVVTGSMGYQMPVQTVEQLSQIDDMNVWWNEPFEEIRIDRSQFTDGENSWIDG